MSNNELKTFDTVVRFFAIVCMAFKYSDSCSVRMQERMRTQEFWDTAGGTVCLCEIFIAGFVKQHSIVLDSQGYPRIDSTTSNPVQRRLPEEVVSFLDELRCGKLQQITARKTLPFLIALAEGFPVPKSSINEFPSS